MSTFRGSRIPANPRKPTQFPRLHTSHERIPIFMIREKDASTPCDERNVKYRRNTNFLTQKKTGGKRIMGNQGAKNWKFIAFFAISLMLIAGLFSDAAIARDGSGTASVTWTPTTDGAGRDTVQTAVFRGDDVLYEHTTVNDGTRHWRWNTRDSCISGANARR